MDICNAIAYLTDSIVDLGCCIIQRPVYIFVSPDQKVPLLQALRRQMGRFLICSDHPYKLLGNSTPLKAATFDIVASLVSANVDTDTFLSYGQKMTSDAVRELRLGDLDPATQVSLDIGFTSSTNGIPLVMPKPDIQWNLGPRSTYPILSPPAAGAAGTPGCR